MCGIAGYLGGDWTAGTDSARARLVRMTDTVTRRGPDSADHWLDPAAGIALGHRRLAVLDLSPAGAQPMISACGRFIVVLNGEIYNHLQLRDEIDAAGSSPAWRGHSDTETLLAGFSAWGVTAMVERCIGMFAFAVWDRQARTLTLGRDRIGEKPLYFGWQGQGENAVFLFGSELKALQAHPAMTATIDRDALCLFFRHNNIPAPYSIFEGIRKLQPGCLLTVSDTQREPTIVRYWSLAGTATAGCANPFAASDQEIVDELENLLRSAVRQQMVADVPLGAFLSGGIDSSTIVALMQAQSDRPVKTFTIGFNEHGFDEAVHARAVASHLGTEHTELYVTSRQALDVIPLLPSLYSEPFADSSQIPTFLVSQLARRHVTVSLSGDAGDELFCGYNRYLLAQRWWSRLSKVPPGIRERLARAVLRVSPSRWNRLVGPLQGLGPASLRQANVGDRLHKAAGILAAADIDALYRGLVSHTDDPASLVIGGTEPPTALSGDRPDLSGLDDIQGMMALDTLMYLPDDILVKVDRAAMGVSLESRVPFLDHRVVEFAWRMPQATKLRDGVGKWAIRQILHRYVPRELIERPKAGFAIPISEWLREPLQDWAEALLDEARIREQGFLEPLPIRQMWHEHLSGKRNWHYQMWNVLMFQAWLESQTAGSVA